VGIMKERDFGLAELEALLESAGSDANRWPPELRVHAEVLLATNAAARATLMEARALDRVLAVAPAPAPDRIAALQVRILEAAAVPRVPANATGSSVRQTVVALQSRASTTAVADGVPQHRREAWGMGGLLAASLVLGLAFGSALMGPSTIAAFGGGEREATVDIVTALWSDGFSAVLDEEFL